MTNYEKYQLLWMIDHGYSLGDLIRELDALQFCRLEEGEILAMPVEELFEEWEFDRGFGGEIWVCEDEFATDEEVR